MATATNSCKDTGSVLSKLTLFMVVESIASKTSLSQLAGTVNEAIDSLAGFSSQNGIGVVGTPNHMVSIPFSVYLSGNVPDFFEDFLTDTFDLMFSKSDTYVLLSFCEQLSENEERALDKTKVVEVEHFVRVINDTLDTMAGAEPDERDS